MRSLLKSTIVLFLSIFFIGCQSETESNSDSKSDAQSESSSLLIEGEEPEVIASSFELSEGPYWHSDGYLLFSDVFANRVHRWSETDGLEVYLEPSGNANGIQADIDGTILIAQHAGRLSRLTSDRELSVVVDSYEGQRLNSPNDLAVHSNGTIYFTDPPFGVSDEERELDFSGVFRLTPEGELSVIYDEFEFPNGIVFSPDESLLYVSDSGTGTVLRFNVDSDGVASSPEEFASLGEMGIAAGVADGMATDETGNLYTTGPQGLTIFDEDGNQIHQIAFDEQITNLGWGGENANQLFITGSDNVYRLELNTTGSKKR